MKRSAGLTIFRRRLQGTRGCFGGPPARQRLLGNRLTVDPRTLTPLVLVRIQVPQPHLFYLIKTSSWRSTQNHNRNTFPVYKSDASRTSSRPIEKRFESYPDCCPDHANDNLLQISPEEPFCRPIIDWLSKELNICKVNIQNQNHYTNCVLRWSGLLEINVERRA